MNRSRMRRLSLWALAAMAGVILGVGSAGGVHKRPPRKPNSCAQCHRLLGPKLGGPVQKLQKDIHAQKGLSCADCHGGDPTTSDISVAMSKERGFVGAPKTAEVPRFCNKCHGDPAYMRRFNPTMPVDQLKAYRASVHGQRLAQGDTKVATCVSCHGTHGILPASHAASQVYPPNVSKTCAKCHGDKEYMAGYNIPTNQLEGYRQSVHAELLLVKRDLSAPTCNDCHGNHGAFPPAVTSVSDMCGRCHVNNRNLFVKSPHHEAFDRLRVPGCVVCHSNHKLLPARDDMVGGGQPAVCIRCHTPGSEGLRVGAVVRTRIEDLKSAIQRANEALDRAERAGMEVSEAKLDMKETRTALIAARTQVHAFSVDPVERETAKGIQVARAGLQAGAAAMDEFHSRRRWVILPILLTLFVAGVLYLKLRQMEG